MTDYSVGTGTSGALIIRDDGFNVYAIIRNNSSQTFANQKAWSIYVGAGSASGSFSIGRGPTEVVVWQGTVGSGGGAVRVTLNMGATGTQGLGGPTSLVVDLPRSSAPPPDTSTIPSAPQNLSAQNIKHTEVGFQFTQPASDGGSQILDFLIRLSKNNPPNQSPYTDKVSVSGSPTASTNIFTGLEPGTQYYATVYARNKNGYSQLASPIGFRTRAGGWRKINGVWKEGVYSIKVAGVWRLAIPYIKRNGAWTNTN